MLRFQELYHKEIVSNLFSSLELKNIMQVPRLEKIVLSMGVKEGVGDNKAVDAAAKELSLIAGQKAVVTKAKKSISSFKLREGMAIGCKVTLRKKRMYEFLERLVYIALPRLRDFRGFSPRSFDGLGNFNFGIKEHIIFPEINYDKIAKIRGLNVTIVTSTTDQEQAKALLTSFNVPFK